jgi:hypothetical protein
MGARGRWQRPFDNHLEGASIERYSEVAEAMNNLQHHSIEETEMPLYGGIDLHANNRVVVLLDEQAQVIYHQRFSKHRPTILEQCAPYPAELTGGW